jgi:hypothetical protein
VLWAGAAMVGWWLTGATSLAQVNPWNPPPNGPPAAGQGPNQTPYQSPYQPPYVATRPDLPPNSNPVMTPDAMPAATPYSAAQPPATSYPPAQPPIAPYCPSQPPASPYPPAQPAPQQYYPNFPVDPAGSLPPVQQLAVDGSLNAFGAPSSQVFTHSPLRSLLARPQPFAVQPVEQGVTQHDWDLGFVARAYYIDDQRIQWSGCESTFGVEGVVSPIFRQRAGDWDISVEGEFYLNQPFDQNILMNTQERMSYAADFQTQTFEISQLFLAARNGDLTLALGKFDTPFGRTYYPLFTNSQMDAPYIRTEAIDIRETGLLARWQPNGLVLDLALTNGGDDKDSNSSKAGMARVGLQGENWAVGASIKVQDGNGSDVQKEFDSYCGGDAMIRFGRLVLSGEAIYDEYGFKNPYNPNLMFWPRSIYYRDEYNGGNPITGVGYYVNAVYQAERWLAMLNYGEFFPETIGIPQQDILKVRTLAKFVYFFTPSVQSYTVGIVENGGWIAQDGRPRNGWAVLSGFQYVF